MFLYFNNKSPAVGASVSHVCNLFHCFIPYCFNQILVVTYLSFIDHAIENSFYIHGGTNLVDIWSYIASCQ